MPLMPAPPMPMKWAYVDSGTDLHAVSAGRPRAGRGLASHIGHTRSGIGARKSLRRGSHRSTRLGVGQEPEQRVTEAWSVEIGVGDHLGCPGGGQ